MEKTITATNGKKERAKPVPQNAERITAGALKLNLEERVKMVKILQAANESEVIEIEDSFNKAKALLSQ